MKGRKTPRLRFKEFHSEWSLKNLGEITTYTKGFAFKSEDYKPLGIRIIRVSDLGANSVKEDLDKAYIDRSLMGRFEKYNIKADDIIITTVGSRPDLKDSAVGRGIYISEENMGLLNQNLLKFNKSKDYDNKFIFSYINSSNYIKYIKTIQRGNANQSNITVKDLLKYEVYTTSYQEQQKIASFLTAVDKKIQQLNKKKALLEQYKKGVMQQIFNQEIRFKDDKGRDFPDWETRELGEISTRCVAKNRDGKVNFVLTNSATKGIVSQQDYFENEIANQNNLFNYYLVSIDSYVYNPRISNSAPVGPIKRNRLSLGVMSPLYTVFKIGHGSLEYFEHYFETNLWHEYMKSIANYGARHDRMSITNKDFFKLPLPFPCLDEQTKIANFLSALDDKIKHVDQQIEMTKLYKKGLLQQMFV
jgi:type I restriction enzyme S subunit